MKKSVFVLFTSMLVLASCTIGNGDVVRQERQVRAFNGISVEGVADVNIQPGDDYKVVVITDENLQHRVITETRNNVLNISIKSRKGFNPTKLIIDIHLPELQSLNLSGVGDVRIADGSATDLAITLSGVGDINALNYRIENVFVKHSGVGDVKIWATHSLEGTLSGVGNIRYKGNPTVNVKVSGVGNVREL